MTEWGMSACPALSSNGAGSRPGPPPKESTGKVGQAGQKTSRGGVGRGAEEEELGGRDPRQRPSWAQPGHIPGAAGLRSLQKEIPSPNAPTL